MLSRKHTRNSEQVGLNVSSSLSGMEGCSFFIGVNVGKICLWRLSRMLLFFLRVEVTFMRGVVGRIKHSGAA